MHETDPSKEVRLLLAFFGESRLPRCAEVRAAELPEPQTAFGRLATIFYERVPAIDLLEIVRPGSCN